MMMAVLAVLIGWNLLRLLVACHNLIANIQLQPGVVASTEAVTVCIPARNEEKNLPLLLEDLALQRQSPESVIVVDDHSEDGTARVVQDYATHFPAVCLVEGQPLPDGWFGKHWACMQAAQMAQTEWLLFVDADLRLHPEAIQAAINYASSHQLSLLSVFPTQQLETPGERNTVPLVHRILLELLPMAVANKTQWASMSAGNGQFMLFRARDYHQFGGHEKVKNERAEDIALVQQFRKQKWRTHTLLGNRLVSCRMYQSYQEAKNGFAKNIKAMMLHSNIFQLIYWLLGLFAYGIIAIEAPIMIFPPLLLAWLTHACAALAAKDPQPWNPWQQLTITLNFFWFSLYAAYAGIAGITQWKGRRLS